MASSAPNTNPIYAAVGTTFGYNGVVQNGNTDETNNAPQAGTSYQIGQIGQKTYVRGVYVSMAGTNNNENLMRFFKYDQNNNQFIMLGMMKLPVTTSGIYTPDLYFPISKPGNFAHAALDAAKYAYDQAVAGIVVSDMVAAAAAYAEAVKAYKETDVGGDIFEQWHQLYVTLHNNADQGWNVSLDARLYIPNW